MLSNLIRLVLLLTILFPSTWSKCIVEKPAAFPNESTTRVSTQNDAEAEAQRIWEQAVAAKGGREHLSSVRNLVIYSRADYLSRRGKTNEVKLVGLYVLPNKSWVWSDLRPDVFGLTVEMYNYETNMKYVITPGDPHHPLEPIEPNEKRGSRALGLAYYLLETKWLKPIPIKASAGKIGSKPVDIVQTTLNGQRVDFTLDRGTHLPAKVSYYTTDKNRTYVTELRLSDYVEINGIKVPQTITYHDGTKYKQSYQFNVEYDPEIFVKPPPLEAGPEAWRPKGKKMN